MSGIGVVAPAVLALRLAARRSPTLAAGRLRRLLTDPAGPADAGIVADLHAVHAEVLFQRGDLAGALDASVVAARAAGALNPQDWPRLITALLIGADLAVWAGHSHAVAACDGIGNAFTYLDQSDGEREQVAAALYAVAVYHHSDAVHGYTLLDDLSRNATLAGPLGVMLSAGLAAMGADQTRSDLPRHGMPPWMPGGLLQPRIDTTAAGYLASRVHAQPAQDRWLSHD